MGHSVDNTDPGELVSPGAVIVGGFRAYAVWQNADKASVNTRFAKECFAGTLMQLVLIFPVLLTP